VDDLLAAELGVRHLAHKLQLWLGSGAT